MKVERCVDLGCGYGDDLALVLKHNPSAESIGIDFGLWNQERLTSRGIKLLSLDIEKEPLPFADDSLDLVIANQVLEHTKEVFWINHEVFRTLKVGGCLFFGTPNVLSLHNRILMLFGRHPTQHKLTSAHVRPFSKTDVYRFYRDIAKDVVRIEGFWGSQFYPFPKSLARPLATVFPSFSFSIFFLIRKIGVYHNQFAEWPRRSGLETNYYTGSLPDGVPTG